MDSFAIRRFAFFSALILLLACHGRTLAGITQLAFASDLYSHLPLIPVISLYMAGSCERSLSVARSDATGFLGFGLVALVLHSLAFTSGSSQDQLSLLVPSAVAAIAAIALACWGRTAVAAFGYPLGFLLFAAPLPVGLEGALERFLQAQSAHAAFGLFALAGTPVLHDATSLHLPGVSLEVAPECSGIHSTVALFITSTLVAFLVLRTPWKRFLLVALVVPLGILRNAFRVFVLGELAVHVDPGVLESSLHRQGGPLFFALSLIPFLGCAYVLGRSDRPRPVSLLSLTSCPSLASSPV